MKLHLVDGTYELFRCFYGAPKAKALDGTETGAVRALLATLLRLLRDDSVTHVAVAFDHTIESFRNTLFPGYKTGDGIDPALWRQAPIAERAAHALGLVVWPMTEFEADDALATAAARYSALGPVDQVVIASPDKDLAQCVRGNTVVLWDRRRGRVIDEHGVIAKWGVPPASIPDYLALVGDTADGIPGLPGWGARSAAAILSRYRRLEHIPDDPAQWDIVVRGAPTLASTLREGRESAMLYRTLATLREDVTIEEGLDDLRWRGARRPALTQLCQEIGAPSFPVQVRDWR